MFSLISIKTKPLFTIDHNQKLINSSVFTTILIKTNNYIWFEPKELRILRKVEEKNLTPCEILTE